MFRLGLAQIRVAGGDRTGNLERATSAVEQAAGRGAEIVVLPEALDLGWTWPASRALAEPIPDGLPCRTLREAARRHRVWLCAGLVEAAGGRVFNAAVLIDSHGEVGAVHRKIHELDIGHACYDLGDRLGVTETPFGTVGLMVCADGFARGQVIARTLGYMGAQVILSPSAWAVPADHDNSRERYGALWRTNYGAVARDFQLWIAGVSNVGWITGGPWAGRNCIGCSLVVGPNGEPAFEAPYGVDADGVYVIEVAPVARPARGTQWDEVWSGASPSVPRSKPHADSGRP